MGYVKAFINKFLAICKILNLYRQPYDPWNESAHKMNQMVSLRLQEKNEKKVFCIGTYHMPCAFRFPVIFYNLVNMADLL